jgi:hypothetical protein
MSYIIGSSEEEGRRAARRVPVGFYVSTLVEDEAHRCFTTNLSATGLYMERLVSPIDRRSRIVQLELPLPGTSDTLWIKGEVVYDCVDALFHGTAVHFATMANRHRRALRDWIASFRRETYGSEIVRTDAGIDIFRPPPRAIGAA